MSAVAYGRGRARVVPISPPGIQRALPGSLRELLAPFLDRACAPTAEEDIGAGRGILAMRPQQRFGDFLPGGAVSEDDAVGDVLLRVERGDLHGDPLTSIPLIDLLDRKRYRTLGRWDELPVVDNPVLLGEAFGCDDAPLRQI